MTRASTAFAAVFAALALAASVARAQQPAAAPAMADRFGWMSGCWGGQSAQASFREIWTIASPDLMIGMSTTMTTGRLASFEFLRIVRANGGLAYVAQPGGAPPTSFQLVDRSKPGVSVFVNGQHDFPKRIGYERVGANTLLAWIDGGEGGTRRIEYPMTRGSGGCQ